jgi:hypothetical protein
VLVVFPSAGASQGRMAEANSLRVLWMRAYRRF